MKHKDPGCCIQNHPKTSIKATANRNTEAISVWESKCYNWKALGGMQALLVASQEHDMLNASVKKLKMMNSVSDCTSIESKCPLH